MKISTRRVILMKISAFAYKICYQWGRLISLAQAIVLAIGVFAVGRAQSTADAQAQSGQVAITCTNPYSGASFELHVDYTQSTVDSHPADITDATISWRDQKDARNYTLDRKSGKLTVIIASATGGNFVYDQCKLGN